MLGEDVLQLGFIVAGTFVVLLAVVVLDGLRVEQGQLAQNLFSVRASTDLDLQVLDP